jgi:hypothetical protein
VKTKGSFVEAKTNPAYDGHAMSSLRKLLIDELEKLPGVEDRPSPVSGGSAIFYKGKEVGHFHSDDLLDLRLGRDLIKKNKLVHPNVGHPDRAKSSHWFEFIFNSKNDVEELVRLFKEAILK